MPNWLFDEGIINFVVISFVCEDISFNLIRAKLRPLNNFLTFAI